ncbi:MAG: diguanylate cyclase (GGDEF) domain-containing protein, partial [Halothiobacillaceae bacterium]
KTIIYPDQNNFSWDVVTLMLLDPEYEIRRMLEDEGATLDDHPALVFASSLQELGSLYPHSLFPLLSAYRPAKHAPLFPAARIRPRTVALLPLVRYGKLIGSFNIGSFDADRFIKGVRTDFFEHLAAIVAICMENATNVQRLKRQGLTDTLTAINNRRFFDQRLKEEIAVAQRSREPLSCMLLDVDLFKKVNDTYGHQVGDQVLREVAALIRAQLRGSDVLSRYGGEEFAALLSRASAETVEEVAQRIRKSIAEHLFQLPEGGAFNITISIGVATFYPPTGGLTPKFSGEALVGSADRCLYQAKGTGRNRVVGVNVP